MKQRSLHSPQHGRSTQALRSWEYWGNIVTDNPAVISFIAVRACPLGTASSYRRHMPNDPEYDGYYCRRSNSLLWGVPSTWSRGISSDTQPGSFSGRNHVTGDYAKGLKQSDQLYCKYPVPISILY